MSKTTIQGLEEPRDAPQVSSTSEESFNSTSLKTLNHKGGSKSLCHWGSGYNSRKRASMSGHNIFVLDVDGKPLTPTTNSKARKLMEGKQAKPIWNKFNQFGIQMLIETRKETPKTVLGCDFGTKFEGYVVVTDKENNLAIMWKLPNKKQLVRKLEERSALRKTRRHRNRRRREVRFDNREKDNFIAPSQKMIINSRLKCIRNLFKCYPINYVVIEDVKFNHRDHKWGKNFSTVEIGKITIKKQIEDLSAMVFLYQGYDTEKLREEFGYKKSYTKDSEIFNSHCSDALALATDLTTKKHIDYGMFIVVDDTYKCVRRKLHYTQLEKGGIKRKYSTGNFKGIRKGTMCEFGQICGGLYDKYIRIYRWDNKRIKRLLTKISWLSHNFKVKYVGCEFL